MTNDDSGDALDALSITTLRTLAMDAVQAADSGHPGTPMGIAPVAYCLWQRMLRYAPNDPLWPNRDRFVLSSGHASMLLYGLLHLAGVREVDREGRVTGEPAVPLGDIQRFRQLDSKCPGHPEFGWTTGVETTTGPLGQGLAVSAGMALAGRWLAARYDRPGYALFDHDVYAVSGDGCMMEGISGEAASLAGHLGLSNLCWIYDSNHITIEGSTDLAFTEDVAARFAAYGWRVERVADANDLAAVERALLAFRGETARPTLIIVTSHIAYGSSHKQDTAAAHGSPLGEEEIRLTKRAYGWPEDAKFRVPPEVLRHFAAGLGARGDGLARAWRERLSAYRAAYPELAAELELMGRRELPAGWEDAIPRFSADPKGLAGRDASSKVLNAVAERIPWLVGGSADLCPSTKTRLNFAGAGDVSATERGGRNLHFGIREHAMGAILNGAVHAGLRAYGSGFLVFSDYMREPIRLAALMELPTLFIFTHDSIGVGEDGPTHQPIEQLVALRAIPGLITLRPADANEVAEAWRLVLRLEHEPAVLVLSRQALPTLDRQRDASADGLAKGAYVLADPPSGAPEVLLLATGSEVSLCLAAQEALGAEGIRARVVSMPSWELFERTDAEYRASVLPPEVTARVAVEQGSPLGWDRYAGPTGAILAMRSFGASAPMEALQRKFGFTKDHVVAAAKAQLAAAAARPKRV